MEIERANLEGEAWWSAVSAELVSYAFCVSFGGIDEPLTTNLIGVWYLPNVLCDTMNSIETFHTGCGYDRKVYLALIVSHNP